MRKNSAIFAVLRRLFNSGAGTWALFFMIPFGLGCTAAALTGAGLGVGVSYTLDNVACKTFNYPLNKVYKAVTVALDRMEISVIVRYELENGKEVKAATQVLDIRVVLEAVTPTATRVKVDARQWPLLKDKATATEIIDQMNEVLSEAARIVPQAVRSGIEKISPEGRI